MYQRIDQIQDRSPLAGHHPFSWLPRLYMQDRASSERLRRLAECHIPGIDDCLLPE